MIKAHTEWSTIELLKQEQVNFSAHIALMLEYLQQHDLPVDDFIRYIGEQAISGWKRMASDVADVMNGILLNVLSNGGAVLNIYIDDVKANATVTQILNHDVAQYYGLSSEIADRFWNKYIPIAEALGMHFSWERTSNGSYEIHLIKEPDTVL